MDTSISNKEYIELGYRVPFDRLSSREWLGIIDATFDRISSILPYMPHIRDLKMALQKVTAWHLYDVECHTVPLGLSYHCGGEPPKDVATDVRLIPLGPLVLQQPSGWRDPEKAPWVEDAFGRDTLSDIHLFISTKRQWIKLERIFVRDCLSGTKTPFNSYVKEFAYEGLSNEGLVELIGGRLDCWYRMLIILQQLASIGIQEKKNHLERLEDVVATLADKRSRITGSRS